MTSSSFSNPDELFDVVNAENRVIGRAPRREVHARNLLHRAVHVLIHDHDGHLFLQRRSPLKDTFPGCWDSSCSGHLDAGEDYETSARRELLEELGFSSATFPLRPVVLLEAGGETGHEFIQVYLLGPTSGPFLLNPEEITEGRWVAAAGLDDAIAQEPDSYAGALRHLWMHRGAILKMLSVLKSQAE